MSDTVKQTDGYESINLGVLEERLGYFFCQPSLLDQALCHSSFAFEAFGELSDNERLEFLGDAVLELAVTANLHQRLSEDKEGRLTNVRAWLVNEQSLYHIAKDLNLGDFVRLGRGEIKSGGANKPSILSDTLEAVLGAVYVDGGFEAAQGVINRLFAQGFDAASRGLSVKDSKTKLQEYLQNTEGVTPRYRVIKSEGPDHKRTFHVEVLSGDDRIGTGCGGSKKEAEQAAAQQALESVKQETPNVE